MVQRKLCLLLVILFLVICSESADEKPRKDSSKSDSKKKVVATADKKEKEKPKVYEKVKDEYDDEDEDLIDDRDPSRVFYNRYLSSNPLEDNYRTRSRWPDSSPTETAAAAPSLYEEWLGGNEYSPSGYGNAFPTPYPSASYDSNPIINNGPKCHSLLDSQYTIFSDTCGAVPQARYSLPNSFGHREKWQVAQTLTSLMSSSTDPTCTRSLRLLLCPIMFPACPTRYESSPPVLPCQSYCRAVKARCGIPALDLLPCEVLPYTSDLCPINPSFGSFLPPGGFPSPNQPLPIAGGFPTSRSFPNLQSLLSSPALQAALSGQGFPSPLSAQGFQSPLGTQGFPSPQAFQSALQMQRFQPGLTSFASSSPTASPSNLFNSGPSATDNLASMFSDFSSRSYPNDYNQASRYAPLTRSSNEIRPSTDARASTDTRNAQADRSSVVKA